MSKVGKRSKLSHLCGSTLGYLVYVFPFVSSLHEAQDSHTPWAFIAERTASYGVCIGPQLILSAQNRNIWYHIADAATLQTWSTILCHTELQYSHHGLTVIFFFFSLHGIKSESLWRTNCTALSPGYFCFFFPSLNGRLLKPCLMSRKKANLGGMSPRQPVRSCSGPLLLWGSPETVLRLALRSLACCVTPEPLSFTVKLQSSAHW